MHSRFPGHMPAEFPAKETAKTLALAGVFALAAGSSAALAQSFPVTPQQRQVAHATAARGVPVSELVPNAPSEYVVKRGDTLCPTGPATRISVAETIAFRTAI